jgi:hypothetical protein
LIYRILPKKTSIFGGHLISNLTRFSFISQKQNRAHLAFFKNEKIFLKNISNKNIISFLDSNINRRILFLINENLDLFTINTLINITNKFPKIKVRNYSRHDNSANYYTCKNFLKIFKNNNNDLLIIVDRNENTECENINIKTRVQNLEHESSTHSLIKRFFIKKTHSDLRYYSAKKTLSLFEGKDIKTSVNIVNSKSSEFILGEAFKTRMIGAILNFEEYLRKINAKTLNLMINSVSNTEGTFFSGIRSIGFKNFATAKLIYSFSVKDNILTRRFLYNFKNFKIIFVSYFSLFTLNNCLLIPILENSFEQNGIFINTLQKVQKLKKVLVGIKSIKSPSFYLHFVYLKKKNKIPYLNFLLELLKKCKIYLYQEINYSYLTIKTPIYKNFLNTYNFYPLKFSKQKLIV